MEDFERGREEILSKAVRAGKRTYFMDVKEMKSGQMYLTITESKRRFDEAQGKFFYEKHKVFLYQEDFEKFVLGLNQMIHFVHTGERPPVEEPVQTHSEVGEDLDFESLGN